MRRGFVRQRALEQRRTSALSRSGACSSLNGRPTGRATRDCCAAERPARIERVFVRAGAVASLNDDQAAAATAPPERPLLIIAGAGTGKTQTLTARVAWLVEQGVRPERLLLLTFTRRAAREMLARTLALLGAREPLGIMGGTFHSVAYR